MIIPEQAVARLRERAGIRSDGDARFMHEVADALDASAQPFMGVQRPEDVARALKDALRVTSEHDLSSVVPD